MARRASIPHALQMRDIKYGEDVSPKQRDAIAEALRSQGRRSEAILLYERHLESLDARSEVDWALKEGSGFHLLSVKRIGAEVTEDEMRRCAIRATELGRYNDARLCYDALGDIEAIRAIAEHLPNSLRPEAEESPEE